MGLLASALGLLAGLGCEAPSPLSVDQVGKVGSVPGLGSPRGPDVSTGGPDVGTPSGPGLDAGPSAELDAGPSPGLDAGAVPPAPTGPPVVPGTLDFGELGEGEATSHTLLVLTQEQALRGLVLVGPASLSATVDGETLVAGQASLFEPPKVASAAHGAIEVTVHVVHEPGAGGPMGGELIVLGDGGETHVPIGVSFEPSGATGGGRPGHGAGFTLAMEASSDGPFVRPLDGPAEVGFDASDSRWAGEPLAGYLWELQVLQGDPEGFELRDADGPTPTLEAWEAGHVRVWFQGVASDGSLSEPAAWGPFPIADPAGIAIDATWTLAGPLAGAGDACCAELEGELDAQGGGASAEDLVDIDVHLLHPFGTGGGIDVNGDGLLDGWFGPVWDAYEGAPTWSPWPLAPGVSSEAAWSGQLHAAGGRDAVRLPTASDVPYRVGLHHAAGDQPATVRVAIRYAGGAATTWSDVELQPGELWDVATLSPASGAVYATSLDAPVVHEGVEAP